MFELVLALPLIFSDKVGGSISADENRYLSAFPQLSLHSGIQRELENWIDDNAGGRAKMRTLYNEINVNVMKTPRDAGSMYQDDWVFMVNDAVVQYLQHTDVMNHEQQKQFIDNYKKIQSALEQNEIYMCGMVYPHKSEMYAERFEKYIIPVVKESQLDVMGSIADENPDMNFNVLSHEFNERKNEGQLLYSKAYDGSHWNNQGAFVGYQALMKEIQNGIPEIKILSEDDFLITEIQQEKVYNGRLYKEIDKDYQVKNPEGIEDNGWFDAIGYQSSDMWNSYRHYKNQDDTLPRILIIGDSYTWMFMIPWLSESFSETVFIHQLDTGNMQWMIDTVHPDVVVFAGLHNCVEASISQAASVVG